MSLLVLLGSIPPAWSGSWPKSRSSNYCAVRVINAVLLIVFGLLLYVVDRIATLKRSMDELRWMDALTMGLAQILALAPGVSRSGITLSAGLLRGLDRPTAARFSFLMSGPIITGAAMFKLREGIPPDERAAAVVGVISATVVTSTGASSGR